MTKIYAFKKPEPEEVVEETMSGPALCIGCKHKWAAVAPVGIHLFECPNCGTEKGTWLGIVEPPGDRWECNCGGQLFFCTPTAFDCAKCGTTQNF